MRTYDQTPDKEVLAVELPKYVGESKDGRLYRVEYTKHSKATGNEYLVTTVGYKNASDQVMTLNKGRYGRINRYRIRHTKDIIDIGPMLSDELNEALKEVEKKEKAKKSFSLNFGNVAKSLDW